MQTYSNLDVLYLDFMQYYYVLLWMFFCLFSAVSASQDSILNKVSTENEKNQTTGEQKKKPSG